MEYYMMVRQKDLVCTAQFVVKPVMAEVKEPKRAQCEIHGCKEDAVGSGVWRGKDAYALCAVHLEEAKSNPKEWNLTPQHGHTVPMDNSEQPEKVPRCSTFRNDDRLEEALGHKAREQP
jgi:hypothetical protein